jgi:hypothetical protein
MNLKFRFIIFKLIVILCSTSSFAGERSRSPDKPLADPHKEVTCKCDANRDPCCIPPTGSSSQGVDESKDKTTDVNKCKCDPKNDPCCKKVEGTKRNNH